MPCTRNPPQRGGTPPLGRAQGPISPGLVLTAGSHAAQAREPRQGRKEATVSDALRAPWERLTGVNPYDTPPGHSQREVRERPGAATRAAPAIFLIPPAGVK